MQVEQLLARSSASGYAEAAVHLAELGELASHRGQLAAYAARLEAMTVLYATSMALQRWLKESGSCRACGVETMADRFTTSIRPYLLAGVLRFVRAARTVEGVVRNVAIERQQMRYAVSKHCSHESRIT